MAAAPQTPEQIERRLRGQRIIAMISFGVVLFSTVLLLTLLLTSDSMAARISQGAIFITTFYMVFTGFVAGYMGMSAYMTRAGK